MLAPSAVFPVENKRLPQGPNLRYLLVPFYVTTIEAPVLTARMTCPFVDRLYVWPFMLYTVHFTGP